MTFGRAAAAPGAAAHLGCAPGAPWPPQSRPKARTASGHLRHRSPKAAARCGCFCVSSQSVTSSTSDPKRSRSAP